MEIEGKIIREQDLRYGRTGYVALLGRPNTGKSTLLNTLLDRHIAAVSSKPQTTRKHLLGIFTDKDAQILFLDAPGIHKGKIAIDDAMDRSIERVLTDADIVLCMADPTRKPGAEDQLATERAAKTNKKVIVAINKTDIATPEQVAECKAFYQTSLPDAPMLEIAAIDKEKSLPLLKYLKENLPQGPFLYDEDEITDVYERDIAAEFIREVLLEQLNQEVPHCVAVAIDKWVEKPSKISIGAILYVEREGHRGIILGHGGQRIKGIRLAAAKRIAEFVQTHVDLSLFIKVKEDWRENKRFLAECGLEMK